MIPLPDKVTRSYTALMTGDDTTARPHCADDVTCHIVGQHPFSGDYHGVDQISAVLRRMDEAAGSQASFTPTNLMSDDSGSQVLIEGVLMHGSYVRHVINRLRYDDDRLVELWLKPLDQRAEDEFWLARLPQQRSGLSDAPVDAEATNGG